MTPPQHIYAKAGEKLFVNMAVLQADFTDTRLVAQLADPDERDHDGRTLLMFAAQAGCAVIALALIEHGADVNAHLDQATALHIVAACGHEDIARILIDAGADPRAQETEGLTPYACAKKFSKNESLIRYLKECQDMDPTALKKELIMPPPLKLRHMRR